MFPRSLSMRIFPLRSFAARFGAVQVEGDGSRDPAHGRGHSIEVDIEIRFAGLPNLIVDTGHRSSAPVLPPLPYLQSRALFLLTL